MLNCYYQTKTSLKNKETTTLQQQVQQQQCYFTTVTTPWLQQCQEVTQTLTMLLLLKLNLNYPTADLLVEEVNQQPSHQQHTFNLNCE